jgi:hypothetical protein
MLNTKKQGFTNLVEDDNEPISDFKGLVNYRHIQVNEFTDYSRFLLDLTFLKVKGKETLFGRALFQFKSWAPETFRKYFGKETPDYILGDVYKGRYRSLWENVLSLDTGGATLMDMLKEFLLNYLNVTSFNTIKSFSDKNSFDHMSEVDRVNMKANIHQFIIMSNLLMLYYVLKYAFSDEDDDRWSTMTANIMIHQISRLQGEMNLYSSPMEMKSFFGNMLPVFAIAKDIADIGTAAVKTIGGDYHMQSGAYEGWYRVPKEIGESLPLSAPIIRMFGTGKGNSPSLERTLVEELIKD